MMTYITLDGTVLTLTNLTEDQRAFLGRCLALFRQGRRWREIACLVTSTEDPLLAATGGRITLTVMDHPLYRAVRDLEDRAGIREGEVAPAPGDDIDRDPVEDDAWIPVAVAAARKGVTVPGLHKAIRRGDVIARPAKPGGRRLIVSVRSLERWQPDPRRRAARREVPAAISRSAGRQSASRLSLCARTARPVCGNALLKGSCSSLTADKLTG